MDEANTDARQASAGVVRRRAGADVEECVEVLARVHRRDGYPVNWPERPAAWLSQDGLLGAWVAVRGGRVVGHVSLSRAGEDDAAAALWSERHGTDRNRTAVLGRLFVDPGDRGRGPGALLVGRAVAEVRALGRHPVPDVVTSDTAAAALDGRLGRERLATVERRCSPSRSVSLRCYAAAAP